MPARFLLPLCGTQQYGLQMQSQVQKVLQPLYTLENQLQILLRPMKRDPAALENIKDISSYPSRTM